MEEKCKDLPQGLESFNPRTENLSVKTVSTTTVSSSTDSQTPPTSWIERVNNSLLFYFNFVELCSLNCLQFMIYQSKNDIF